MAEFAELLELVKQGRQDDLAAVFAAEPGVAALRDGQGVSLLLHALYNRQGGIAHLLRQRVAEVDLFEAAALGDIEQLHKRLSAGEADVNAHAGDGFTALQLACYFGRAAATDALIRAGADVEAVAQNGMALRAVHAAASSGDSESLRLLLDAGADPNSTQHGGYTPLHAAAARGNAELAHMLLKAGADKSAATADGKTAADLAQANGHGELAEQLGAVV